MARDVSPPMSLGRHVTDAVAKILFFGRAERGL